MLNFFKSLFRDIKNNYLGISHPFGKKILATKEFYLKKFEEVKNFKYENIENFLPVKKYPIEKNWLDNLALHTQIVKKKSQINYQHGRILYSCLKEYILSNQHKYIEILEIGTARGFSSLCMSKSIMDCNIRGNIFTIDIIPHNKAFFWNCIDDHEKPKTREELLLKWHEQLQNIRFVTGPSRFVLKKLNINRINFAFVDGMHDISNVKREFNFISLRQKKNDIIIFDDVSDNFPEVIKFIKNIKKLNTYQIQTLASEIDRSYAICTKLND